MRFSVVSVFLKLLKPTVLQSNSKKTEILNCKINHEARKPKSRNKTESGFEMASHFGRSNVTLLGDKSTGQVLYLEAGHEFINYLLSLLAISPASQFNILRENSSLSLPKTALGNLYSSIEKMQNPFLKAKKEGILHPPIHSDFVESLSKLGINGEKLHKSDSIPRYRCSRASNGNWHDGRFHVDCESSVISRTKNAICPNCHQGKMDKEVEIRDDLTPDNSGIPLLKDSEYVRDSVTFLVTDDLQFFPVSVIKSLTALTKANIGRLEDLASCDIEIDEKMVLGILKTAHESSSVLNKLFNKEFMSIVSGEYVEL